MLKILHILLSIYTAQYDLNCELHCRNKFNLVIRVSDSLTSLRNKFIKDCLFNIKDLE